VVVVVGDACATGAAVLEDAAAVSLASALASVAVADASVACVETTVALRSAMSRDANVWPAVTVCPTDASTALTVPDTLKLRFA
jgi:hypothetical protein